MPDAGLPAGTIGDDALQLIAGIAGEMVAIGMRHLFVLDADRLVDLGMGVAEAMDGRAPEPSR